MKGLNGLQTYHYVWLQKHPDRTEAWLRERLKDGFHIHHVDNNHGNDDPDNIVMIEGRDHMILHGRPMFLKRAKASPERKAQRDLFRKLMIRYGKAWHSQNRIWDQERLRRFRITDAYNYPVKHG